MKKIFIRADGGKSIGMGHIMRMLVLAEELRKEYEVIFLCRNNSNDKYLSGINKIESEKFKVILIDETNVIKDIIKIQNIENAELLITDSYDVEEFYFDKLEKYFHKTIYIDDINICRINSDMIINQNINAKQYDYNTYPNKQTKLLLGTQYILLRNEFRNFERTKLNEKVSDIMLTVGGMDDDYLTLKAIQALSEFDVNLHVVIGGAFEEKLTDEICSFKSDRLKVISCKNAIMSEIMKKCDLAISACGSTLYELSVMQVPTIGIVVADNQISVAKYMEKNNMIINTNNLIYTDLGMFNKIVYSTINDFNLRKELIHNSKKHIDVNGAKRIMKEIAMLIS
ncbi:UDP-2,4-diacetamido-2,4,6-trideoxy-beta-L-altropyranose hydrolase [Clostridium beijerinckii]|uniref:UDP-2,4-diacetamido-2,4, 6-trideoxy-beta-L-altropyranose hydrolase n=1 Tax=Clostridium beijerinckii TaxID=1520 RepID=UPI00232BDDE3|nr:UDP-2,4-diacetamido-2,4,6-trideoxy-beta-L-altropyranose hydrolase [Clostridium beijerinckii]